MEYLREWALAESESGTAGITYASHSAIQGWISAKVASALKAEPEPLCATIR